MSPWSYQVSDSGSLSLSLSVFFQFYTLLETSICPTRRHLWRWFSLGYVSFVAHSWPSISIWWLINPHRFLLRKALQPLTIGAEKEGFLDYSIHEVEVSGSTIICCEMIYSQHSQVGSLCWFYSDSKWDCWLMGQYVYWKEIHSRSNMSVAPGFLVTSHQTTSVRAHLDECYLYSSTFYQAHSYERAITMNSSIPFPCQNHFHKAPVLRPCLDSWPICSISSTCWLVDIRTRLTPSIWNNRWPPSPWLIG